jgi:hypothetical protein
VFEGFEFFVHDGKVKCAITANRLSTTAATLSQNPIFVLEIDAMYPLKSTSIALIVHKSFIAYSFCYVFIIAEWDKVVNCF